jgi:hypothetical protein
MSNRFYVNGFQPFENNYLGKKTYQELCRQGIIWKEDRWVCKKQKIKEVLPLLEAINTDIMLDLKQRILIDGQKWEEITDYDLYGTKLNYIKEELYDNEAMPIPYSYFWLKRDLEDRMAFIPMFLWLHIKPCCTVRWENGKPIITIKKNRAIWVEMY